MLKRIITAVVALAIFVPVLIYSYTWVFPAVIAVLSFVAVYEICDCFGCGTKAYLYIPLFVLAGAAPFLLRYSASHPSFITSLAYALPLIIIFELAVAMLSRGKIRYTDNAGICLFAFYAVYGLAALVILRDVQFGNYIYLLAFIGAWATDTGAYFAGVLLGKHKLIPEVSPKKTVEGSIGGIIGCCIGFAVWGFIVQAISGCTVYWLILMAYAVAAGVVSQIGDLVASYVKREKGIKDYGFIFPGHGGVMDRFDSVIAVSIVLSSVMLMTEAFPIDMVPPVG